MYQFNKEAAITAFSVYISYVIHIKCGITRQTAPSSGMREMWRYKEKWEKNRQGEREKQTEE